jgi:Helicase associated domain
MTKRRRGKTRVGNAKRTVRDAVWEQRFGELTAYRRQHGSCQVPSRSRTHPSLGHWVHYQRVLQRAGRLSAARRRLLEQIGFDWVSRGRSLAFRDSTYWDTKWERMLGRLTRFHRRFGHCLVPADWAGTPSLRAWLERQRHVKQQGLLRADRWRRLKALGLEWKTGDFVDPRWTRSVQRLLAFRRRFGHCRVPATWAEDVNLGRWVVKTRRLKNTGRLSAEKVRRLNEAGFVWDARATRQSTQDAVWSAWLAKLHAFHQQYGHWRVPTDQRRFHRLRVWMDNQRISYHRGWLTAARIRELQAIKFPWVSDRGATPRPH